MVVRAANPVCHQRSACHLERRDIDSAVATAATRRNGGVTTVWVRLLRDATAPLSCNRRQKGSRSSGTFSAPASERCLRARGARRRGGVTFAVCEGGCARAVVGGRSVRTAARALTFIRLQPRLWPSPRRLAARAVDRRAIAAIVRARNSDRCLRLAACWSRRVLGRRQQLERACEALEGLGGAREAAVQLIWMDEAGKPTVGLPKLLDCHAAGLEVIGLRSAEPLPPRGTRGNFEAVPAGHQRVCGSRASSHGEARVSGTPRL